MLIRPGRDPQHVVGCIVPDMLFNATLEDVCMSLNFCTCHDCADASCVHLLRPRQWDPETTSSDEIVGRLDCAPEKDGLLLHVVAASLSKLEQLLGTQLLFSYCSDAYRR